GDQRDAPARFLDGRTRDASVGLAPAVGPPFTGTSWRVHRLATREFAFENQGDFKAPRRWLDGITATGAVSLPPSTGGRFTGTCWRIDRLVMHQRLDALDIATGQVKLPRPPGRHEQVVEIEGSASQRPFDPAQHLNRPALLLQDNTVYVAFGAHADRPHWQGWVFAYDATTLKPLAPYLVRPTGDAAGP